MRKRAWSDLFYCPAFFLSFFLFYFALNLFSPSSVQASRPCSLNQSCFEWIGNSLAKNASTWDPGTTNTLNQALSGWFLNLNGIQLPFIGYSFHSHIYTVKVIVDPSRVFQEGSNAIRLCFNVGMHLSGVSFELFYHPAHTKHSKLIKRGVLQHDSYNQIDCGLIQMSLQEIDPGLYAQIEALKREIVHFNLTVQASGQEIHGHDQAALEAQAQEQKYQEDLNVITDQLEWLNAELLKQNFSDFNSIQLENMVQLVNQDPLIAKLYHELTRSVSKLQESVQAEIQSNQDKIEATLIELNASFAEVEPLDFSFNHSAHYAGSAGSTEGSSFDDQEPRPPTDQETPSKTEEILKTINHEVLENLKSALAKGNLADFQSIFSTWNVEQKHMTQFLQDHHATIAQLHEVQKAQNCVLQFIKEQLGEDGFFLKAPIPENIKHIVGTLLKEWNPAFSKSLVHALNTWGAQNQGASLDSTLRLSPIKSEILDTIEQAGQVLTDLSASQPRELLEIQAHKLAEQALEAAFDPLILSAQGARSTHRAAPYKEGPSGSQTQSSAAQELLREAQTLLEVAGQLARFMSTAGSYIPVVGGLKDHYDGCAGVTC